MILTQVVQIELCNTSKRTALGVARHSKPPYLFIFLGGNELNDELKIQADHTCSCPSVY